MSQHDYVIDNQSFPATRTDLNNALSAIVSQNSGASAPSTTYAYQLWYDTTNDTLKMRNSDDDAWIDLFDVNQTTDVATIAADGSGDISLGNFKFDSDQTVGAAQDDNVLTYDNSTGKISLEPAGAGGTGSIIKTLYTQFTGTNTITTSGDTVLTDLTVDITPSSTSSIIRIDAMVNGEWDTFQAAATNCVWFFYRDTTKLAHPTAGSRNVGIQMGTGVTYGAGDNADSTPETAYYTYFDAPNTTSQITYKVGVNNNYYNYDWHLNRTVADTNNNQYERGASFICVTEIKG